MDAVIDKDLGSAVLAKEIGAGILSILTSVDNVAINFGKPDQKILEQVTLAETQDSITPRGTFPPGSMGPKILAAIKFLEDGGEMVTITSFQNARKARCRRGGNTDRTGLIMCRLSQEAIDDILKRGRIYEVGGAVRDRFLNKETGSRTATIW